MGNINIPGSYNLPKQSNYGTIEPVDENRGQSLDEPILEEKPLIEPFNIAIACACLFSAANIFLPYEGLTTERAVAIMGATISLAIALAIAIAESNEEAQPRSDRGESSNINTGAKRIIDEAENEISNPEKKVRFA